MDADRLARLTDKQRACLRMVYAHLTSKEIAPRLGIEPGSVDQHIKAAMRVLGVGDRRSAAILLAEHEGLGTPQPLVYQPPGIDPAPESATLGPSTEGERESEASAGAMREDQAAYQATPPPRTRGLRLPLPIAGGKPGDLTAMQRLGWIAIIMLTIALTFGVFLAGLEALSRLGRAVSS